MRTLQKVIILLLAVLMWQQASARNRSAARTMRAVFRYASTVDTCRGGQTITTYTYLKYCMRTNRRNFLLLGVPNLYAVANGGAREYVGETYDRVDFSGIGHMKATRLLERTTIPHSSRTMPTLLKYLTPNVYEEMLIDNNILSPFNERNRRLYRYKILTTTADTTVVSITPRLHNTRLVRGRASICKGRIMRALLDGEFDLIRFHIDVRMGKSGMASLMPQTCSLNARFLFLGNDMTMEYEAVHGLPKQISDTILSRRDTTLLNQVRPIPLTAHERRLFDLRFPLKPSSQVSNSDTTAVADSTATPAVAQETKSDGKFTKRMWESLGRRLFIRTRGRFGTRAQGHFRLNPLLNPVAFGYSRSKGLTYKFNLRGNYFITDKQALEMRVKAGYSFRQHTFYYTVPLTYYFNYRKKGYVSVQLGNGNRIRNSSVIDDIKQERRDSVDLSKSDIKYFNDFNLKLEANLDPSIHWGGSVSLVTHRRTAVDKAGLELLGRPTRYISTAPVLELRYRPTGYKGPVFTANYERSFKGFLNANIAYERCEFDAQYNKALPGLQALQMRLGTGFYTHRGDDWIFLDYSNFRDNNIPGGWNDDWANEFELLNSKWYNASEYYVRANLTYETPLLIAARLPLVGRLIEKERIYVNALSVSRLNAYVEYGYGFATRLFSVGMFLAQKEGRFDGFGCKFGFELFRSW